MARSSSLKSKKITKLEMFHAVGIVARAQAMAQSAQAMIDDADEDDTPVKVEFTTGSQGLVTMPARDVIAVLSGIGVEVKK